MEILKMAMTLKSLHFCPPWRMQGQQTNGLLRRVKEILMADLPLAALLKSPKVPQLPLALHLDDQQLQNERLPELVNRPPPLPTTMLQTPEERTLVMYNNGI